jgi:hypothetical protein
MKKIKLFKAGEKKACRFYALVDDEDHDSLNKYNWELREIRHHRYAKTIIDGKWVSMHRVVMGVRDRSILVDHANGDGIDNQRHNLRTATMAQNLRNRKKNSHHKGKPTSSKYKGVTRRGKNLWQARTNFEGTFYYLGGFRTEEEAALAYNDFAEKHHGKFARLNDIPAD